MSEKNGKHIIEPDGIETICFRDPDNRSRLVEVVVDVMALEKQFYLVDFNCPTPEGDAEAYARWMEGYKAVISGLGTEDNPLPRMSEAMVLSLRKRIDVLCKELQKKMGWAPPTDAATEATGTPKPSTENLPSPSSTVLMSQTGHHGNNG